MPLVAIRKLELVVAFALRVRNALWENYLGIDTRGRSAATKADGCHYATISYASIFKVLKQLNPSSATSIADIGCGKGRVVCCAASMGFEHVSGVEYSSELAEEARRNLAGQRGRKQSADIVCAAAEDHDYDNISSIYMYNPFGRDTMRAFVQKLIDGTAPGQEKLVAYVYPLYGSELEAAGFELVDQWTKGMEIPEHDVAFYRYRASRVDIARTFPWAVPALTAASQLAADVSLLPLPA